jgi:hypothetical protein
MVKLISRGMATDPVIHTVSKQSCQKFKVILKEQKRYWQRFRYELASKLFFRVTALHGLFYS